MTYYTYVQCKDSTGLLGCFIAASDRVAVSPVFNCLVPLFTWMNENGWKRVEGGQPWEVICAK